MSEQDIINLKVFFDGIESHIDEFKRYMKEDTTETISKKHVERFLNDVMIEVTETRNDIAILKKE